MKKRLLPIVLLSAVAAAPAVASAETFESGSLIIPMDTDYQDMGMLEAYGLVYELLRQGVEIQWTIRQGKGFGDVDFTTSAVDHQTNDVVDGHGYRGGPFVIHAADADEALGIIDAWQQDNPDTAVHEVTEAFDADVAHTLVAAPTIAMFADGNEDIARGYMQAAKIPDSVGDPDWPDESPDMLDVEEVSGPSDEVHNDGALFNEDGVPIYCQLMSMHWGVGDAEDNPEVVAEVRSYLSHPTHFFAECQAVNAFENLDPFGYFLTPNGFLIGDGPDAHDFFNADTAFGQLDGAFESVGGSEPAYTLPDGDMYKADDIVMITEQGTPVGVNDVWMTGVIDGVCPESNGNADARCLGAGKVSYLGGHEYKTDLPISENPDTQGTRLFLNSLFEAPCATAEGFPKLELIKDGTAQTDLPEVTYTISYTNLGPTTALAAVLHDTLPAGAAFVSASEGGALNGDTVEWDIGTLGKGAGGSVELTVTLGALGTYENTATIDYTVGVSEFALDSNVVVTVYGDVEETTAGTGSGSDGSGGSDSDGSTGGDSSAGPTGEASSDGDPSGATTDTETVGASGGEDAPGCGCRSGGGEPVTPLMLLAAALGLRRRRRG